MQEEYFTDRDEIVKVIYDTLLAKMTTELDDFELEYKKTSVHVTAGKAFLGIHFMKKVLPINIVLDHALNSSRVHQAEKVSTNRYHNEIRLTSPSEVDAELMSWIKAAYALKR